MSIWRSIDCKCGNDSFEVADNGTGIEVRITCTECRRDMVLPLNKNESVGFVEALSKGGGK